jgi:hypothetical protein
MPLATCLAVASAVTVVGLVLRRDPRPEGDEPMLAILNDETTRYRDHLPTRSQIDGRTD